jgi:hypothetical protein
MDKTSSPLRDIRLIRAIRLHASSGSDLSVLGIQSCNFLLVQDFRFLYIA